MIDPRPADTETTTWGMAMNVVDGTPVVSWVERPWTPDELAERAAVAADLARRAALVESIAWLRARQAECAAATGTTPTINTTNAVATLIVVVRQLGVMMGGLADLIETGRLG